MNTDPVVPVERAHLEAAAQWWARLQDSETAATDLPSWLEWLEAEPGNREAYRRIQELTLRLHATRQATSPCAPGNGRLRALAATVLLGIAGGAWLWHLHSSAAPATLSLSTQVAALEQAPLPDGSIILLGGASSVRAEYTDTLRSIQLTEGEAFFEVRNERSNRPFVVHAGPVSIRAMGTAFNVRKTDDRVTVTVSEGKIQMTRIPRGNAILLPLDRSGAHVSVTAGEQATYDPDLDRVAVVEVDTSRAVAWRQRRLEFIDEPLDAVIANVNRYSPRHIEVRASDLHKLSYTGTFYAGALEEWLIALERAFPIEVTVGADEVIITPRD